MSTHPMNTTNPFHALHLTILAFLPLFLFLLFVPVTALTDDLAALASPREIAVFSGIAQEHQQAVAALPKVPEYAVKRKLWLTVTAYSSTVDQTDGDPFTTAAGTTVRDGIIAHNGLPFGTRVRFPDAFGDKVFIVQDRLNPRHGAYIADLWMPSREQAKQWGARVLRMEILAANPHTKVL